MSVKDENGRLKYNTFLYLNQPEYFEVDGICEIFNQKTWKKPLNDKGLLSQEIKSFLKTHNFQKATEEEGLVPFQSEEIDVFLMHPIGGFWLQGDNGRYYILIFIE